MSVVSRSLKMGIKWAKHDIHVWVPIKCCHFINTEQTVLNFNYEACFNVVLLVLNKATKQTNKKTNKTPKKQTNSTAFKE